MAVTTALTTGATSIGGVEMKKQSKSSGRPSHVTQTAGTGKHKDRQALMAEMRRKGIPRELTGLLFSAGYVSLTSS